ncbi:MAG: hypothetical protein M2R45_03724 [Verrucomicrobia subdivision 3 bacterium]|nr:hypothetical protein [Limisphaerales bacterium]MCS1416952.1 hypothetical protein [Limisphaerales bacterium]
MVESIDVNVGQFLIKLEVLVLEEGTVVFF